MYASSRLITVQQSGVLLAFLLVGVLFGGAGGYAIATASSSAAVTSSGGATTADTKAEDLARFHASEHEGSIERSVIGAGSGPQNIVFLQSEHVGSAENPSATR